MTTLSPGPQSRELLVCTDGSPASQGAVEAALVLARRWPCRLRLLQVLDYNPGFASQAPDAVQEWEREVWEGLRPVLARARAEGLEAEALVRRGERAPHAILAAAEEHRPVLIVMGRRGRTDVAEVLMGSVTARVIGLSPVNVLVVPRKAPLTFQRLLVACDGSPYSEAAWREALSLAKAWFSHLLAVSVAQWDSELREVQSILEKLQDDAEREGIPLDTLLLRGVPGEAILRAGQARGADLIILGSHGRTGLKRLFLGSVAEHIVGQAWCPVLVVKRHD